MGNTMLSTSEAMSSIYTQLSGTDKGVLPLVEACNLILDYILKNGFGSSQTNPLTPAQLEKIKEDVINKVKTQVPLGVLLKDCELNNSKIKFTLSDNSIKELDLTSLITNTVRDYVNTHKTELKGQKGDKGEQGQRGIQGKSAYDLWLEKGNVGTEVDFLNSLKGQKGDTGSQGLQGNNGTSLDYEWQGTKLGIKKSSENSYSYVDLKGSQGVQGSQGTKGDKGVGIKDVSINGNNLSIKLDDESTKVITLPLLKGEQGLNGNDGVSITNITNVGSEITISLSNGTNKKFTIPTIKGDNGTQGLNGENGVGISNIEKIGTKLVITLTNSQKKEFELPISSSSGTTGGTTTNGRDGVSLDFTWNGTQLGIKKSTDTDYTYTELKGQKGDNGLNGVQGEQGVSLDFNWQGTRLGIKKSTETDYTYVELKGEQGNQGLQGEKGIGIKEITLVGNNLNIKLDDDSVKIITLPNLQGNNGNDGVGINNISVVGSELTIDLSNGTQKKINIPTVSGENGISITEVKKQNNKLVISLSDGQEKEIDLPSTTITEQDVKAITDPLYKSAIESKLSRGNLSESTTAEDLKNLIDSNTTKLTKATTELNLVGNNLKFKENNIEKNIELPQGITIQQVKSTIDTEYVPTISSKLEKGTYVGTATDLSNEINNKADKTTLTEYAKKTDLADKVDNSTYTTDKLNLTNDINLKQDKATALKITDVQAEVNKIIGNAPESLNTLQEIAEALGNDPNKINTILTQLGLKAEKSDLDNLKEKVITDIRFSNNIITYKENNIDKTIDLSSYVNLSTANIETIVENKGNTLYESKDTTIVKNLDYNTVDRKLTYQVNGVNKEINLPSLKGDTGTSLDFNWNGTQLGIKKDTESTYTYKELKGEQGVQGLRGERGHNSVIVSETEPNKAEYDVWIKPTENGIDIESLLQQGSQGSSDNNKLIKGTGSPKGVVQAEVNTLYLDKAKTNGAYLWLKTGNNNTDWKVIKGDTGTIEFTSKVLDGKIRIRRIDNWVILNFGGLQWDLFRLKPKAEVNGSSARKYTYNGNTALQLRLTNKTNLTQFAIPYGLRSVYPIYTPLFHDSGVLLGSIFIAPNSDGNQIRFNILSTEYADNGYVDLRCSNIIYYTEDDYPENLQNLIRGLTQ